MSIHTCNCLADLSLAQMLLKALCGFTCLCETSQSHYCYLIVEGAMLCLAKWWFPLAMLTK